MRGYHPTVMEIIRFLRPPMPKSINRLRSSIRVMIRPDLARHKSSTTMRLRRAMLAIVTLALVAFMWLVLDTLNLLLSNLAPALANELGTDPYGDVAKFMSGLEMLLLPLCAALFCFSSLLTFRRNIILNSLDLNAMFMTAPVFRTAEQIHQDDIDQLEQCINIGCLKMNEHIAGCDKAMFTQQMFDDLVRTPQPAPRHAQDGLMLLPTSARTDPQSIPDDDKRQRYAKEKSNFERYNSTVIKMTLVSSASCLVPLAIQAAIAAGYGVLLGVQSLF